MQTTYKGHTASKIAKQMTADAVQPATYWVTIGGIEYRVTAHRDTVEMYNGSRASSLVLDCGNYRIALRWHGGPSSVTSATVAA